MLSSFYFPRNVWICVHSLPRKTGIAPKRGRKIAASFQFPSVFQMWLKAKWGKCHIERNVQIVCISPMQSWSILFRASRVQIDGPMGLPVPLCQRVARHPNETIGSGVGGWECSSLKLWGWRVTSEAADPNYLTGNEPLLHAHFKNDIFFGSFFFKGRWSILRQSQRPLLIQQGRILFSLMILFADILDHPCHQVLHCELNISYRVLYFVCLTFRCKAKWSKS